jgi:hypothetical protein
VVRDLKTKLMVRLIVASDELGLGHCAFGQALRVHSVLDEHHVVGDGGVSHCMK